MTQRDLASDPYLDRGLRGWIVRTATKEYWRVASWYELPDLIQDGYLCYAKCRVQYVGKAPANTAVRPLPASNPDSTAIRHFTALVQRTFLNHITDLAKARMRLPDVAVSQLGSDDVSESSIWEKLTAVEDLGSTGSTIKQLLVSAPQELLDLAKLLASDAGFQRKRRGRRLIRETNNERYCRLLGLDPSQHDIVGLLRQHFK